MGSLKHSQNLNKKVTAKLSREHLFLRIKGGGYNDSHQKHIFLYSLKSFFLCQNNSEFHSPIFILILICIRHSTDNSRIYFLRKKVKYRFNYIFCTSCLACWYFRDNFYYDWTRLKIFVLFVNIKPKFSQYLPLFMKMFRY